jgi:hypothetical protein
MRGRTWAWGQATAADDASGALRRPHEGSCLSGDPLFALCGCLRCFPGCVFGGGFPLTGRRAVLAAASASKRPQRLPIGHCGAPHRSVPSRSRSPSVVAVVISLGHPRYVCPWPFGRRLSVRRSRARSRKAHRRCLPARHLDQARWARSARPSRRWPFGFDLCRS